MHLRHLARSLQFGLLGLLVACSALDPGSVELGGATEPDASVVGPWDTDQVRDAVQSRDAPHPHTDGATEPEDVMVPPAPDASLADSGDVSEPALPWCGDGTCQDTESCQGCAADCGPCPLNSCTGTGGRSCGGDATGGDPATLYRCVDGQWTPERQCQGTCEVMPRGVPDRCPDELDVPAGLVTSLEVTPYVEGNCEPATYPGWPYEAKRCRYSAGGMSATVTVANPPARRVAEWVVDASSFIPTLWDLKRRDPARYEEGVKVIGRAAMLQSSRIFPLTGGILENMGNGWVNYPFEKGVTQGCSTGCYCRINSLHRTDYCAWREAMGQESSQDCLARVGTRGLTAGWGGQCLQNHIDAWTSPRNEHFRAKVWKANQSVRSACPSYTSCSPADVVAAVRAAFN